MKKAYFLAYNLCNPGGTTRYIENFIFELKKIGILSTVINHLDFKEDYILPKDYIIVEEKNFSYETINPEGSVLFICREEFFEKAISIKAINPNLFIVGEIHAPIQIYKNNFQPIDEIDLYKVNTKYSKQYFLENYKCSNVINNYVSICHIQDFIDNNILTEETINDEDTTNEIVDENNINISEIINSKVDDLGEEDYEKFSSEYDINIDENVLENSKNLFIHTRFDDGQKNVQYAIKLVAAYNLINEAKISLYINGYGPCENMYKTLVKFYNISEYVTINSNDVPSNCIHLSTARSESFGYSIAEGLLSNHILVYRGLYPEIDEIYDNVEAVTFLNGNIYEDVEIVKSIWNKEPIDIAQQIQRIYDNTDINNFAKNYIDKIKLYREKNGKLNVPGTGK